MNTDFLVIGGGVIGLRFAIRLKELFPKKKVCLIEKEPSFGLHASGRNSGVIHAGFYYSPGSLKANLTREGNKRLRDYCLENHIPLRQCGKVIVAQSEKELPILEELFMRGQQNGVELHCIDEHTLHTIDPHVRTVKKALYSPTTASVNPLHILQAFVRDALNAGVMLMPTTKYLKKENMTILTNRGKIEAGYVVNAAGLYADKIAHDFGCAQHLCILPFKGLYLLGKEMQPSLKLHVYPVPNIHNPFLGVHFTVAVDGSIKIGPTAIPAFWREQYSFMKHFQLGEFLEIARLDLGLLMHNRFHFAKLALEEIQKMSKKHLLKRASALVHALHPQQFQTWGSPGIRAQLFDKKNRRLVMDFCLEQTAHSLHVLNAVSPAFTCAISFVEHVFS